VRKVFLSFADARLSRSLVRIHREASSLDFYDEIVTHDETNLDRQFRTRFASVLRPNIRGFGYWVWKPQIILQVLRTMNEGDVVQYADVGFHLNPGGTWRLRDYFDIASAAPSGVLAFQGKRPQPPLLDDGRDLPTWPDRFWIKGDLLDHLDVRNDPSILDTPTIQAGLLFIRKCPASINFLESWLSVFETDFTLVDDSPSRSPNLPGFREHRHDQSVFTVLGKRNNIETLSSNEFWYPKPWISQGDWRALRNFPLHAKRSLDFGPAGNLRRSLSKISSALRPRNFSYSLRLMMNRVRRLIEQKQS
jgi:hypothetical protein